MHHLSLFAAMAMAATPAHPASPVTILSGDAGRPNAAVAAVIAQARRDAEAISHHLAEHLAAHRADAPGWPCLKRTSRQVVLEMRSLAGAMASTNHNVPPPHEVDYRDCADCADCAEATPGGAGSPGCREPKPAS